MAILTADGVLFPDNTELTAGFRIIAVRFAYDASAITSATQRSAQFLNCEVTMPPTDSNNSRYLVMGESNIDDTNENTCGADLELWVGVTPAGGGTETTYWVSRPGTHSHYWGGNTNDKYWQLKNFHIDDGATTTTISQGQTRRYRAYGNNHNNNVNFGAGTNGDEGPRHKLIVIEFDGGLI